MPGYDVKEAEGTTSSLVLDTAGGHVPKTANNKNQLAKSVTKMLDQNSYTDRRMQFGLVRHKYGFV